MPRRRTRGGRPGGNNLVLIVLVLAGVGALAAAGSGLQGPQGPPSPGGGGTRQTRDAGETLTMAWGIAPASLDPAFAVDSTSANLGWNLFDPLVKLDEDLDPVPSVARGWEVTENGRRVTFFLREDVRWTNGDPVTAADFEYAWKRVLSAELGSPLASRLLGIAGAKAYNECVIACRRLRERVGVTAGGDHELVVTLASRQPWFVASTADVAFLPVHRATVERYGDEWTATENIVTNGPFTLVARDEESVSLAKDPRWRNAAKVHLGRVQGRFITDSVARVQAFDAGEVMALDGSGLPAADLPALRERREYETYPALGTYLYAFNLATITDVRQRRAMALAVDRRAIAENVIQADVAPATRVVPVAAWAAGEEPEPSPWFPAEGDVDEARTQLEDAVSVKREVTLVHVDEPRSRELALALRDAWRAIGIETTIRSRPEETYLALPGPLSRTSVDVYQADVRYSFGDAFAGLAAWTCDADENKTNFCDVEYDALMARARREPDAAAREELYEAAEEMLSGDEGDLPAVPIFWHTFANLESLKVKESFTINPLGQIDLSAVETR